MTDSQRRHAFGIANRLGFSRSDRLDFASELFERQVRTWQFNEPDWATLIAALRACEIGFELARQAGRLRDDMRETG